MLKSIVKIVLIISLGLNFACSNDDENNSVNLFNPPEAIHGIWVDQCVNTNEDCIIRLTITSHNIIEQNYPEGLYPDEFVNFKEKFNPNEFDIEEIITPTTYEVIIERKDGQFIQEEYGITTFRRKYFRAVIVGVAPVALGLEYTGSQGMFLIPEPD